MVTPPWMKEKKLNMLVMKYTCVKLQMKKIPQKIRECGHFIFTGALYSGENGGSGTFYLRDSTADLLI
jgi:hypothetical protein